MYIWLAVMNWSAYMVNNAWQVWQPWSSNDSMLCSWRAAPTASALNKQNHWTSQKRKKRFLDCLCSPDLSLHREIVHWFFLASFASGTMNSAFFSSGIVTDMVASWYSSSIGPFICISCFYKQTTNKTFQLEHSRIITPTPWLLFWLCKCAHQNNVL